MKAPGDEGGPSLVYMESHGCHVCDNGAIMGWLIGHADGSMEGRNEEMTDTLLLY
jgi:hypothetical protein